MSCPGNEKAAASRSRDIAGLFNRQQCSRPCYTSPTPTQCPSLVNRSRWWQRWLSICLQPLTDMDSERLKLISEMKLSGGITVDTAATTLALADLHNSQQLKAKCVDYIVTTPAVLDAALPTEGYKQLEASCLWVLADLLKSARGTKN